MSSKEDSPIARVQTSFQQITNAADTLNAISDQVGKVVSRLDSSFQKLNVGISDWVRFRDSSSEDGLQFWYDEVGYAKVGGKWGLAIRSIAGDERRDEYSSYEEWLFNDAPRALRIDAVDKIPDLFEKLGKEVASTTVAVGTKLTLLEEFAKAVDDIVAKRKTTIGEMMGSLGREKVKAMATYYVLSVVLAVVFIAAATTIVIYALNKKGDVNAGFTVNRLGFTLSAKERPPEADSKRLPSPAGDGLPR